MLDKQQVFSLLQSNRLREAKTLCAGLCERNRSDAEAWFLLAGIHAQLGELDEVIRCCRQVVVLEPMNVAAHYNLGVALQSRSLTEESAQSYRQVLRIQPDNALALANLGLALRELGKPEEAMMCCQQASKLQPALVEVHNTLGLLLKDQGRIEEAAEYFRQAIALRPEYAEAHFNLALCHQAREDPVSAEACFRRAIELRPGYAEAHGCLGSLLVAAGKLDDAVISFRRAIELNPESAENQRGLGIALAFQRKWDQAVSQFRLALKLKPDSADAYVSLGNALLGWDQGPRHGKEAEACFLQALRCKPDDPEIHLNLAAMLVDMGRDEEAEAYYRRVLELDPDHSAGIAGLAMLFERKGNFDAGLALVQPLIDAGTNDTQAMLSYAALLRNQDRRAEAVTLLEKVLQQSLDTKRRVDVHFALGKLYDELRQYDNAFGHYRQANTFDVKEFNEQEVVHQFDAILAAFAPARIGNRPRASNRSRLPVFIVGMPRSGTSLVEQILASHPLVHGAGELIDIFDIASQLPSTLGTRRFYPNCVDDLSRKSVDSIAQKHLDRLGRLSRDVMRVTDKMPHNFMYLGLIDLLFPGARIIHCMRDPVDTCLSIYFQRFNDFHAYARDLTSLGRYYRQYLRLMAHWKKVLRIPLMEVQYEDLVENQEVISRKMIEFCELEWDDRCLRFHETGRFVTTPSYDQVRRPIYKKSVARWKNYEQFLEPLVNALRE
ncbi:MAG: tetratricopeptide repeat protein [Acidiferrobacterales bacterium]